VGSVGLLTEVFEVVQKLYHRGKILLMNVGRSLGQVAVDGLGLLGGLDRLDQPPRIEQRAGQGRQRLGQEARALAWLARWASGSCSARSRWMASACSAGLTAGLPPW
jgi:hypothetical protein